MNSKLGALLSALGGGCIGIPLFFQQTSNSTKTVSAEIIEVKPSIPTKVEIKKPAIPEPQKRIQDGNCTVVNVVGDLQKILWKLSDQWSDDYIAFNCVNAGENVDKKIPNKWTGLFFKKSLKGEGERFFKGEKYVINTNTSVLSTGNYRTIFSGNIFPTSSITGQWNESIWKEGDKNAVSVSVDGKPNLVYIVFTGRLKK